MKITNNIEEYKNLHSKLDKKLWFTARIHY